MNRISKLLIFSCAVVMVTGCANRAASTPEEFARSVVELLVANDSEELVEFLYPSKEVLRDFAPEVVPEDRLEKNPGRLG